MKHAAAPRPGRILCRRGSAVADRPAGVAGTWRFRRTWRAGRIGCRLTEAPGRPTSLPWGIHAPATTARCPGCLAGVAMHPSFLYEIAFQLAAFAVLLRLRNRVTQPGELFVLYVAGYAVFRYCVEFVRANETVWPGLTRPQWFLLPSLVLIAIRLRPAGATCNLRCPTCFAGPAQRRRSPRRARQCRPASRAGKRQP